MVKIKKQLVSSRSKTYAGVNGRKFITIHETANYDKGTGAQTHANLQSNGFSSSWHWSVDDKEAIQSFPHTVQCWHAGDGRGDGNLNSIGIEICVNEDSNFVQAVANAAGLVRMIMAEEGIPAENVVQHNHWSGKNCPTNLRNGSKGIDWNEFKRQISEDKVKTASTEEANKEEDILTQSLEPSIHALNKAVQSVLYKLEQDKEQPLSPQWRKKFEKRELSVSDSVALIYVAIDRGYIAK